LAEAVIVLKGLGRNFIFFAFAGMIMGMIAMLGNWGGEATSFGWGFATLIITGLYAILANILLVLPFRHRLEAVLARRKA
jgi:flagellar motor component MotA